MVAGGRGGVERVRRDHLRVSGNAAVRGAAALCPFAAPYLIIWLRYFSLLYNSFLERSAAKIYPKKNRKREGKKTSPRSVLDTFGGVCEGVY